MVTRSYVLSSAFAIEEIKQGITPSTSSNSSRPRPSTPISLSLPVHDQVITSTAISQQHSLPPLSASLGYEGGLWHLNGSERVGDPDRHLLSPMNFNLVLPIPARVK
jgi:hypothetical protein